MPNSTKAKRPRLLPFRPPPDGISPRKARRQSSEIASRAEEERIARGLVCVLAPLPFIELRLLTPRRGDAKTQGRVQFRQSHISDHTHPTELVDRIHRIYRIPPETGRNPILFHPVNPVENSQRHSAAHTSIPSEIHRFSHVVRRLWDRCDLRSQISN
jgi:hypothetical protein